MLAERLRHALLDGSFAAGSRLNEVHLARDLDVSRTPLRAALQTLAGEGLLHHTPNRGFTVPEQSLQSIIEAYEMRALAEGLASRFAAERGIDGELRQTLETSLASGDDALTGRKSDATRRGLYAEANEAFHGAIHEAAKSMLIKDVLRICQRVPHALSRNIVAFDLEDVRKRHEAHHRIFDAIIAHEPDTAEKLMREHVLSVKSSVARSFR